MTLRLGRHEFTDDATLMMAIVNRTPDSFYDKGATWAEDKAFDRVAEVVDQGAEIVDIGGIKAAPGAFIDEDEEKRRVVSFVERVRAACEFQLGTSNLVHIASGGGGSSTTTDLRLAIELAGTRLHEELDEHP